METFAEFLKESANSGKKAVLTKKYFDHPEGDKIEVLEFKGSGRYRVKFSNGKTDIIGKSSFEFLEEALKTNNPSYGYSGQILGNESVREAKWKETFVKIQKATGEKDELKIRNYLDSAHGRHLYKHEDDVEYVKKDFKKFSRTYNPENYE